MTPQDLGKRVFRLLNITKGDEIIFFRDKITGGILVAKGKEGGDQSNV
ncbi:MAG: hypothetical protein ABSF82_05525 [Candidatus Bathyarchaeia archaeon]|jgi:hypothetical protein